MEDTAPQNDMPPEAMDSSFSSGGDSSTPSNDTPDFGGGDSSSFLDGLMGVAESGEDSSPSESSTENNSDTSTPETPAQEEKPVEDPDLADLPKSASQKTKADWKAAKEARRKLEAERDSLRTELESLKKAPKTEENKQEIEAIRAELEQYKSRISEYEAKVAAADITLSPEYQENIGKPLANAESLIGEFAQKYELDIRQIASAAMKDSVLERNAMLAELASGMNDFDRLEFKKVVDDARSLYFRSEKAKADAQTSLKYLEEKRQKEAQEQQARQQELRTKASQQVWDSLTKGLPEVLRSDEATLQSLAKDALSSDILSAPPEIQAYATQAAVLLPTLKEKLESLAKENAELKASIAKRSGASPKAKSGAIPAASESEEPEDFMSGLDAILQRR